MTYKPTYDRTNWRREETRELIEAARDSGHELAIALGERLEKVAQQLHYENEDWVD
jgi:hydroxymethylpyrimidine pyrophosphatase-like HAD family hydrolase